MGLVGTVIPTDGNHHHRPGHDRCRDGRPVPSAFRIEPLRRPEDRTIALPMGCQPIRPPDQQRWLAGLVVRDRRGIPVVVLRRRLEGPVPSPPHLAGLLVERGDPGIPLVHPGQDHEAVGDHRRAALVPEEAFRSKTLGQVLFPADASVQREGREGTALEVHEHSPAIGGGRGVAARGQGGVLGVRVRAELRLPRDLTRRRHGHHGILPVRRRGQIDAVAGNDRCGGPLPGEGQRPPDIGRRPQGRSALGGRATLSGRPTPVGPVVLGSTPGGPEGGNGNDTGQQGTTEKRTLDFETLFHGW